MGKPIRVFLLPLHKCLLLTNQMIKSLAEFYDKSNEIIKKHLFCAVFNKEIENEV